MNLNREGKIFDVVLLVIIGAFIVLSFTFNETARLFPFYFGLVAFLFVLMNIVVGSMENPPKLLRFIKQKGAMSGLSDPTGDSQEDDEEEISWKQIMKVVYWLIGFIVGLAFIHYLVTTFLFLALLLAVAGKVPWLKSTLISVFFTGFLYILFEVIL